jgi:hypothetical protein
MQIYSISYILSVEDRSLPKWRCVVKEGFSTFLFCAAAFFIGVAATIKLLCWISVRNCGDKGEGCFGNIIALFTIGLALYLIYFAATVN